jgi:hypothetical protein
MRTILVSTALLVAGMAASAKADDPYRWCAQNIGNGGATNCYFVTHKQCREAVAGTGGICVPNGFYTGPDKPWEKMKKQQPR